MVTQRLSFDDIERMSEAELSGWDKFWNSDSVRRCSPDEVRGWWYGHRRAYALGAQGCIRNFENPFPQFSAAWEAWADGYNDEAANLIGKVYLS